MGCNSCCSYPNGYITIAVGLLSIVAYILTSASIYSCRYAKTQIDGYDDVGVGLFNREVTDSVWISYGTSSDGASCTQYFASYSMDYIFDSNIKAAQGLAITAFIVGFIMIIVVWSVAPCVRAPKAGWQIIGGFFFILGMCQILTLLLLSSNICSNGCKLSTGGIVGVVAFLCWMATSLMCCFVKEPAPPPAPPLPVVAEAASPVHSHSAAPAVMPTVMAQETTTQHVEADGTIVIERVRTNTDGTTVVTSEIIPPASAKVATAVASSNYDNISKV